MDTKEHRLIYGRFRQQRQENRQNRRDERRSGDTPQNMNTTRPIERKDVGQDTRIALKNRFDATQVKMKVLIEKFQTNPKLYLNAWKKFTPEFNKAQIAYLDVQTRKAESCRTYCQMHLDPANQALKALEDILTKSITDAEMITNPEGSEEVQNEKKSAKPVEQKETKKYAEIQQLLDNLIRNLPNDALSTETTVALSEINAALEDKGSEKDECLVALGLMKEKISPTMGQMERSFTPMTVRNERNETEYTIYADMTDLTVRVEQVEKEEPETKTKEDPVKKPQTLDDYAARDIANSASKKVKSRSTKNKPAETADQFATLTKQTNAALANVVEAKAQVEIKSDYSTAKIESWISATEKYISTAQTEHDTRRELGTQDARFNKLTADITEQTAKLKELRVMLAERGETSPNKNRPAPENKESKDEGTNLELEQAKNRFRMIKGMLDGLRTKFDESKAQTDLDAFRNGVREAISNRRTQIQERKDTGDNMASDTISSELRQQIIELQNNYLQPYAEKKGTEAPNADKDQSAAVDLPQDVAEKSEGTNTVPENADLNQKIDNLTKMFEELMKLIRPLLERLNILEKPATTPETPVVPASPDEPKTSVEKQGKLSEEIAALKTERAKVDVNWKETISKGYDELHKGNDAGFKRLDSMELQAKDLDQEIKQKEAALKALQEGKEVTESNVDALLKSRTDLNAQLVGLEPGKTEERNTIKVKIEAIDAKLDALRTTLKADLTGLSATDGKDRRDSISADIQKINEVLGETTVDSGSVATDTTEKETPEQEKNRKISAALKTVATKIGETFRDTGVSLPDTRIDTIDGVKQYVILALEKAKDSKSPIYLEGDTIYVKQNALLVDSLNPDGIVDPYFRSKMLSNPAKAFSDLGVIAIVSTECSPDDKKYIQSLADCFKDIA